MLQALFLRLSFCIGVLGLSLYSYIHKQNQVTALKVQIPQLAGQIKEINEEKMRLKYEIEQFENPQHLMELARADAFAHLKHPLVKEIVTLQQAVAFQVPAREVAKISRVKPSVALASTQP